MGSPYRMKSIAAPVVIALLFAVAQAVISDVTSNPVESQAAGMMQPTVATQPSQPQMPMMFNNANAASPLRNFGLTDLDLSSIGNARIDKIDDLDTSALESGIQSLTDFGADLGTPSENEGDMLARFQKNLATMARKVAEQHDQLKENEELILKYEKLQKINEDIVKKNSQIVKNASGDLVEMVKKYTEGLDLGSSSSGAGGAAFMEKMGRLKYRAKNNAF